MKKLILSLAAACLFLNVSAQSDSAYFEVGLNVIKLTNFLGVADEPSQQDVWNPYTLTANFGRNRLLLRSGFGYTSLYNSENSLENVSFDTTSKAMDFRVGFGRDFIISSKWNLKLGVDYFMANRTSIYEANFKDQNGEIIANKRDITYREKGVEPFLFVQYNFMRRVSIGTELLFRISSYRNIDKNTSNGNTNQIVKEYSGAKRILMAPSALFVQIRF